MKAKSIKRKSVEEIKVEFGKSKSGKHEFHNNSCCVLSLNEK